MVNQSQNNQSAPGFIEQVINQIEGANGLHFAYNPSTGLYVYKPELGIYVDDIDAAFTKHIITLNNPNILSNNINEIVTRIKNINYKEQKEFNREKNIIVLKDCNFDLSNGNISDHTHTEIHTVRIPIHYDPKATCPEIDRYLSKVVHPKDLVLLEELSGYVLTSGYTEKYLFFLFGPIDSGKSLFLTLLSALVGNNASNVPPNALTSDQYASSQLFGKKLNICGDISGGYLSGTDIFKRLVGDDMIYSNKKFEQPLNFKNEAKMVFSANKLPIIKDDFENFIQKVKVIRFPNTIPKNEQDKKLQTKITTPEELSGFLNKALAGLTRLVSNNGFTANITGDELRKFWLSKSDDVVAFIDSAIELSAFDVTVKDDVFQHFENYCKLRGVKNTRSKDMFWKSFKTYLTHKEKESGTAIDYNRHVGGRGAQKTAIGGISLIPLNEIKEFQKPTTASTTQSTHINQTQQTQDMLKVDTSITTEDNSERFTGVDITYDDVQDIDTRTPFEIYQDELAEQYYKELDAEIDETIRKEQEKLPVKEELEE